jgi:hypothetical protein
MPQCYVNVMLTSNAYAFAQIDNERSGSKKVLLPERRWMETTAT